MVAQQRDRLGLCVRRVHLNEDMIANNSGWMGEGDVVGRHAGAGAMDVDSAAQELQLGMFFGSGEADSVGSRRIDAVVDVGRVQELERGHDPRAGRSSVNEEERTLCMHRCM